MGAGQTGTGQDRDSVHALSVHGASPYTLPPRPCPCPCPLCVLHVQEQGI
jgi:hypothetical protein